MENYKDQTWANFMGSLQESPWQCFVAPLLNAKDVVVSRWLIDHQYIFDFRKRYIFFCLSHLHYSIPVDPLNL